MSILFRGGVAAVLLALGAVACGKSTPAAAPDAKPAVATPQPTSEAPPPASQPVAERPLVQRPGGPTIEACGKAADHLAALVVDSAIGPDEEQRKYVEHLAARDRDRVVRYCIEVAVPREIDCVLSAKNGPGLMDCGRMRRQFPKELPEHKEPTQADCELFFDRLRGFKIEEGADPAVVDHDRDQLVRACQEKAKVGTITCFVASPTYEQARRCP